jgi:hypothetical protein
MKFILGFILLLVCSIGQAQVNFQQAYQVAPLVPSGLLEAVAWTNTRMVHLENVTEGCSGIPVPYGIMGLHEDGKNYFLKNGELVANLSGISIANQKINPESQITAYAIAFSALMEIEVGVNGDLNNGNAIRNVLHQLSEIPQEGMVNLLARDMQVYEILSFMKNQEMASLYSFTPANFSLPTIFGNQNFAVLSGHKIEIHPTQIVGNNNAQYSIASTKSTEFGPAIWNPTPSCNYSSRNGTAISAITIHTIQGSYAGAISWSQNCSSSVSYHYVVRSSDGQITQMVLEANKAWHVGSENPYTIGYEHEGYVDNPVWYTDTLYGSSAAISRDIVNSGYGIPAIRTYYGVATVGTNLLGNCTKIKGHQHFANQSHTDPGINWNWEKYYRLINNNPAVTLLTNPSDPFYDTGGVGGNYQDDERETWVIEPVNAQSVTLNFTSFNVESGYDNLFIYDGNSIDAPLIASYTGTNSPGNITSTGGALTVEFRSDCATMSTGWAANYTSVQLSNNFPSTSIVAGNTWQTDDFQIDFSDTDADNDVAQQFYLIDQKQVTDVEWAADGSFGFADEVFNDSDNNWTNINGTFSLIFGAYAFSDIANGNSNSSMNVVQTNASNYLYSWEQSITSSSTNQRAGMHFFCSDVTQTNRGNSYFIFLRESDNKAQIYSVDNNVFNLEVDIPYNIEVGQTYYVKTIYNPTSGLIRLYIDDAFIGDWTDVTPMTSGNAISLRTAGCEARFDNVKVYKSRAAQVNVTAGFGQEMSVESEGATPTAKVKTIVVDAQSHWSTEVEQDYLLDFSPPNFNTIADGASTDIDTFYTSLVEANWDIFDIHSDIESYMIAVGTLPNTADVVPWTSIGTNSVFSTILSNPIYNTVYYVSIQAQNNADLTSIFITDGQRYMAGLGLENQQANLDDLLIFPNPASESFSVKNAPENLEVLMYDMNGKLCLTSSNVENPIDISDLASGKYNVILKVDNVFIVRELIVK